MHEHVPVANLNPFYEIEIIAIHVPNAHFIFAGLQCYWLKVTRDDQIPTHAPHYLILKAKYYPKFEVNILLFDYFVANAFVTLKLPILVL